MKRIQTRLKDGKQMCRALLKTPFAERRALNMEEHRLGRGSQGSTAGNSMQASIGC